MVADFLAHIRSSLENADCLWVVQMPDSELENWLFKPGPQHIKALTWVLTKIDPELQKHFQVIREKDIEKDIVRLFVCLGFAKSSESDKVLGYASRKVQETFWDGILYQISLMQNNEDDENHQPGKPDLLLSSLISSCDFWDLIEQKPNLLPSDIANLAPAPDIAATNLEELQRQLAEAEEAYYDSLHESESSQECSNSCLDTRSRLQENRIPKDIVELFKVQRNKIDDCYKKFLHQIAGVIKRRPPNPAGEQLAQMVVNLHGNLQEFLQFLENADKTKSSVTSISSRSLPESSNAPKNSLHDFIAAMEQQISSISATLSANNDLL